MGSEIVVSYQALFQLFILYDLLIILFEKSIGCPMHERNLSAYAHRVPIEFRFFQVCFSDSCCLQRALLSNRGALVLSELDEG